MKNAFRIAPFSILRVRNLPVPEYLVTCPSFLLKKKNLGGGQKTIDHCFQTVGRPLFLLFFLLVFLNFRGQQCFRIGEKSSGGSCLPAPPPPLAESWMPLILTNDDTSEIADLASEES